MSIVYRLAVPSDQHAIWELHEASSDAQLLRYVQNKGIAHIDVNEYTASGGAIWVAELDQSIVGMVGVRFLGDGKAKISALRVLPPHRRSGIAENLMHILEAYCREKNIREIVLGVNEQTQSAIGLYEKLKYVQYAKKRVNDTLTAVYFRKILET